jgi:hypothetical protein
VRVAMFRESSQYRHSAGLDYENGEFVILGAGPTSREHVAQMDSANELVWASEDARLLALGLPDRQQDRPASPPDAAPNVESEPRGKVGLVALAVGLAVVLVIAGLAMAVGGYFVARLVLQQRVAPGPSDSASTVATTTAASATNPVNASPAAVDVRPLAVPKSAIHTPLQGSAERQALMDAARASSEQSGLFVVHELHVSGTWAVGELSRVGVKHEPFVDVYAWHQVGGVWECLMNQGEMGADPSDPRPTIRRALRSLGVPSSLVTALRFE